ncbi:hypothetical protein ACQPTN_39630 [Bradyrhizobium sp. 13971]
MGLAAEALHLELAVAGVERAAERRRRLSRSPEGEQVTFEIKAYIAQSDLPSKARALGELILSVAGYAQVSKLAQALNADYRTFVDPAWPMRRF